MIRNVRPDDAEQLCALYNYYVTNTIITFEESPVLKDEMEARIVEVSPDLPWLVYQDQDEILGFAYANKWKGRCAYRYTVESTVYVKNTSLGRGIGTQLYKNLLKEISTLNIHTVIGGIALPNEKSQNLHEKLGFQKVAHFEQVGFKFGSWIDVGYWQLGIHEKSIT